MPNVIVEEVPVEPVAASTGWAVGACVAAVGFGAALAYLFDPHRGKYRRAILRNSNKSAHLVREAAAQMEGARRGYGDRLSGFVAEARHIVESGDAPDDVLVARVRAKLGRLVDRPHDIETLVVDGVVTLRGKVNAERMEQLVYGVSNVHGVRGVHNQLLGSGPEPAQFGGFGKAIAGFGLALGVVKLLRRA